MTAVAGSPCVLSRIKSVVCCNYDLFVGRHLKAARYYSTLGMSIS